MNYLHNKENNDEALQQYIDLVTKENFRSSKIMFLVPRSNIVYNYKKQINLNLSEELNITTYQGFVKRELVKYWPVVLEMCEEIKEKSVSPTFILNNLCEYLLITEVDKKRNIEGDFSDITATSKSISRSIKQNIENAANNLIDFKNIGEKIYSSKKNKDSMNRFSFSQMDEVIDYYINILLSNSMLDSALSVYLYNNYLLKDLNYIKNLRKDLDYLVVESLELSSNAEVEFIDNISRYFKETHIYFDRKKDFSIFNNTDMEYISDRLLYSNNAYVNNNIVLDESYRGVSLEELSSLDLRINIDDSSQLYNQMIDNIINTIEELVGKGYRKRDIVLISPINDSILDMRLKSKLSKRSLKIENTKIDRKISDYPYANALLVATCIFYNKFDFINDEEYVNFISIVLNVNPIAARNIFDNRFIIENGCKDKSNCINDEILDINNNAEDSILNNEVFTEKNDNKEYNNFILYKNVFDYIVDKRKDDITINEFLIKFYVDYMLQLQNGKENVKICKKIVHESKLFTENINKLGLSDKKSKEEIFIEAFKMTAYDYYSIIDLNEMKDSENIILTTPYTYITSNTNRPIQLWIDIGSNLWSMKIEKEISNLVVLRKSFIENQVFTKEIEESFKKYYLYNTIYNILSSANEVYAFKSEYSVNGFIQESNLYGIFKKIQSEKEAKLE